MIRMLGLGGLLLAAPAFAAPPMWAVQQGQSRVGFSGANAGTKFTGQFGQWTAQIRFDPADLAHSAANVTIGTASARTGDKFQEATLVEGEWFDPAHFPRATFVTRSIAAAGPGRYLADGVLTIKGKALPVKLPFTLKIAGNTATMAGQVNIDRIAFGVGAKADATGQWVTRQIGLSINLVAQRQ